MNNEAKSAPTYTLGTIDAQGREFAFTELGEFRSGMEARDKWNSLPRNGVAYVFETRRLSKRGVVYGMSVKLVATA